MQRLPQMLVEELGLIKLQLQAEERGVVSIKGVSANRFLAMKEDGRLLALILHGFSLMTSFSLAFPKIFWVDGLIDGVYEKKVSCRCHTPGPSSKCFFFERLESNNYNTYRSRKYSDWYVALKRTGQYKPGPKTGPGQKAILFLPMSAKS
nr:PREDICTED: fibroblast growth factor 2 [Balearica regulorum gibbericeps]